MKTVKVKTSELEGTALDWAGYRQGFLDGREDAIEQTGLGLRVL